MIHPAAGMYRGDFAEPVGLRVLQIKELLPRPAWRQLVRR